VSPDGGPQTWRPTASVEALRRRAQILSRIRAFFERRGVLEVETPILSAAAVTDLHLTSVACTTAGGRRWLRTSPELAMKRLLAAGSGPIYEIAKAFRDGEAGRWHNPEFTILEWYRPGFDHHRLMDEMDELLGEVLGVGPAERTSYGTLFERDLGLDPHRATVERLRAVAAEHGLDVAGLEERDGWLQLLASHLLEPSLGRGRPTFVHGFPPAQAALARVRDGVAERFEVYVEGVELANGFHELTDPVEQRQRFTADLERRRTNGRPEVPVDARFLAALASGLPACAGVALGVDRLVMLALGASSIAEVTSFPSDRA